MQKIALIENLQRADLNALDQARGLQRLQQEFTLSPHAVGKAVGKSRSAVTNLLRLLNLLPEVQALLEEGSIESTIKGLISTLRIEKLNFDILVVNLRKNNFFYQI